MKKWKLFTLIFVVLVVLILLVGQLISISPVKKNIINEFNVEKMNKGINNHDS